MKVHTFLGKASMEGLKHMDEQINQWLDRHEVVPAHIKQSFGMDQHHDGRRQEPVLVISIWYEGGKEKDQFA